MSIESQNKLHKLRAQEERQILNIMGGQDDKQQKNKVQIGG
jgi:hypothetical protein